MSWTTERLPEKPGEYQVTLKHLDGDYTVKQIMYIGDKWQGMEGHPSWQVIAWQPLPEPYNEKSNYMDELLEKYGRRGK